MELSYDEIRRIHRLEKSSVKLVQVDQEFYNDLNSFLSGEKKTYLDSLKNFSSSNTRDFTNLKKMAEEIFSMRIKKILNAALIAWRTGDVDDSRMALQEKKVFRDLLSVLKKHGNIIDDIFSDNGSPSSGKKDLNNLSVKILSDIPEFVGADMNEYGPFKKGEVVELPLKIAKLLSDKKLTEVMS